MPHKQNVKFVSLAQADPMLPVPQAPSTSLRTEVGPKPNTFQISDVQTSEVSEVPLAGQVQAHLRPILPPSACVEDLQGLI